MKIACINDQIFPSRDTDTEQIFSSFSALGRQMNAEVTFVFPKKRCGSATDLTAEELALYYEVENNFSVVFCKSLFPSFRALEKVAHAAAILKCPEVRSADVIYSRNLPTVIAVLALSDKKAVYETFRPWGDQVRLMVPILKWMINRKNLLGIVTHSRLAGQSYVKLGLSEERLLVAYNGFDVERLEPRLTKNQAREILDLPVDEPIVCYAGHVNMAKGLGIMLKMAEKMPNVYFVIVGSYGEGEVEHAAASVSNIRIVPWQAFRKTVPYLYASDVLFIPPTAGPLKKVGNTVLPIKTYFYMASGRAIFGPSTPDLTEILCDQKNAILVPPDNFNVALSSLRDLLKDKEKMKNLGEQAMRDVAPYTWDVRAQKVLQFIQTRIKEE